MEKWILTITKQVRHIISDDEISVLQMEIRAYKLSGPCNNDGKNSEITHYWSSVCANERFPILAKLARFCLILPHGNAEVERLFSSMGDILTKKRQLLDEYSVKALLFCKSTLLTNEWNCFNFPITQTLCQMTKNARAAYHLRLEAEKRAEDKRREEVLRKHEELLNKQRASSKTLKSINSSLEEIDSSLVQSSEAMKHAEALELQARKLRESAFSKQCQQLNEKRKILQKKEKVEKRIASNAFSIAKNDFVIPKKKKDNN